MAKEKQNRLTTATRDYTLNLGKMTQKTQFKKRAKKAISSMRQHAARVMGTKDVRIDPKLNKTQQTTVRSPVPRLYVITHGEHG